MIALQYPPLWLGFVGVPVWAAATKGGGWVRDFRVRLRAIDVPLGLVVGTLAQLVVVPLVSWPVLKLTGTDTEDLGKLARELGEKADSTFGVVLLFVVVAIGAPIAEELFFRGLVLGSLQKRFGAGWAVVGSSVFFGATHFQPLQFAALTAAGVVFALLVVRTGRLGPAIIAHMAFNAVTVIHVVWGSP
jgi:membrane protease YdiL (CAAX protease family)